MANNVTFEEIVNEAYNIGTMNKGGGAIGAIDFIIPTKPPNKGLTIFPICPAFVYINTPSKIPTRNENRIIAMIDEHEITKKAYDEKQKIIDSANDIGPAFVYINTPSKIPTRNIIIITISKLSPANPLADDVVFFFLFLPKVIPPFAHFLLNHYNK